MDMQLTNHQSNWLLYSLGFELQWQDNKVCCMYRGQLWMRRHHEKCHDEQTSVAHNSHTTCAHLPREELQWRGWRAIKKKEITQAQYDYQDVQIKKLIKKQGVKMTEKDNKGRLMDELSPHIESEFNKDSPKTCCGRSR